jgi:hypothetical protein
MARAAIIVHYAREARVVQFLHREVAMFGDVAVRTQHAWLIGTVAVCLAGCAGQTAEDGAAGADSAVEANVAAARRLAEEPWNNNNLAVLQELEAPGVASHTNGVRDTLTSQAFIEATKQQYPDGRLQVVDAFGVGDKVVQHWTWTGTAAPSANQATIHGVNISRWADGKMIESHAFYDLMAFTVATGATVVPPAGAAVPPPTTGR